MDYLKLLINLNLNGLNVYWCLTLYQVLTLIKVMVNTLLRSLTLKQVFNIFKFYNLL